MILISLILATAPPSFARISEITPARETCQTQLIDSTPAWLWEIWRDFDISGVTPKDPATRRYLARLHREVTEFRRQHAPHEGFTPEWLTGEYIAYLNGDMPRDPSTRRFILRRSAPGRRPSPRIEEPPLSIDHAPAWLWRKYLGLLQDRDLHLGPGELDYILRLERATHAYAASQKPIDLDRIPAWLRHKYLDFVIDGQMASDPATRRMVVRLLIAARWRPL